MSEYNDTEAYEFYADPKNRESEGERTKGPAKRLTSHVPIRFHPKTIDLVKRISAEEGMTVSAWIRKVIDSEVERRAPRQSETGHDWEGAVVVDRVEGIHESTSTTV